MGGISTVRENLTEEEIERVVGLLLEATPMHKILVNLNMTMYALDKLMNKDPILRQRIIQARMDGLDFAGGKLQTAHEDIADVNKARLFSDNTKWLLSKLKPRVYGDRLDLNVTQTVDIKSALDAAKSRLLDARDVSNSGPSIETLEISSSDLDGQPEATGELVDKVLK